VARIVKENQEDQAIREILMPLVQRGLVTLPSRSILKEGICAADAPGKPVSEMVIEDRR